jgi:hypothetical protein
MVQCFINILNKILLMKNQNIATLCVLILFCSLCSTAQNVQSKIVAVNEPDYSKPKLFADLPDRIKFDPVPLSDLFSVAVGQSINISIAPGFDFSGQVVSISNASVSTSVVVRSTNRLGARLVFTRLTDSTNSIKYIGRIISPKHGDSYEIVSENDQYFFQKKGIYDLMTE